MTRHGFEFLFNRAARAALTVSVIFTAACSLDTAPDEQPTAADISISGTTPNPLQVIVSTDFFEQLNTSTGAYTPILVTSDTVEITLPYARTVDISELGSVYVELFQPEVETATVNMKVDLSNGERFERNATMSDGAQLIYYFIFYRFGV